MMDWVVREEGREVLREREDGMGRGLFEGNDVEGVEVDVDVEFDFEFVGKVGRVDESCFLRDFDFDFEGAIAVSTFTF